MHAPGSRDGIGAVTYTLETPTVDDLHRALAEHDPDQPLELAIVRGVDDMQLTVTFDRDGDAADDEGSADR